MAEVQLRPHPAQVDAFAERISVSLERSGARLRLSFRIEAGWARLRVPPSQAPGFRDGLWQHTCVEAFVAESDPLAEVSPFLQPYLEYNLSPSGEWACYRFTSYREPDPGWPEAAHPPDIHVCHGDGILRLDASLTVPAGGALRLGLSAVLEANDGGFAYWALSHPAERPDFHHPAARTLLLPGGPA